MKFKNLFNEALDDSKKEIKKGVKKNDFTKDRIHPTNTPEMDLAKGWPEEGVEQGVHRIPSDSPSFEGSYWFISNNFNDDETNKRPIHPEPDYLNDEDEHTGDDYVEMHGVSHPSKNVDFKSNNNTDSDHYDEGGNLDIDKKNGGHLIGNDKPLPKLKTYEPKISKNQDIYTIKEQYKHIYKENQNNMKPSIQEQIDRIQQMILFKEGMSFNDVKLLTEKEESGAEGAETPSVGAVDAKTATNARSSSKVTDYSAASSISTEKGAPTEKGDVSGVVGTEKATLAAKDASELVKGEPLEPVKGEPLEPGYGEPLEPVKGEPGSGEQTGPTQTSDISKATLSAPLKGMVELVSVTGFDGNLPSGINMTLGKNRSLGGLKASNVTLLGGKGVENKLPIALYSFADGGQIAAVPTSQFDTYSKAVTQTYGEDKTYQLSTNTFKAGETKEGEYEGMTFITMPNGGKNKYPGLNDSEEFNNNLDKGLGGGSGPGPGNLAFNAGLDISKLSASKSVPLGDDKYPTTLALSDTKDNTYVASNPTKETTIKGVEGDEVSYITMTPDEKGNNYKMIVTKGKFKGPMAKAFDEMGQEHTSKTFKVDGEEFVAFNTGGKTPTKSSIEKVLNQPFMARKAVQDRSKVKGGSEKRGSYGAPSFGARGFGDGKGLAFGTSQSAYNPFGGAETGKFGAAAKGDLSRGVRGQLKDMSKSELLKLVGQLGGEEEENRRDLNESRNPRKRVIKLREADLYKIVDRVISEQKEGKGCAESEGGSGCIKKKDGQWVIMNNKKGGIFKRCSSKRDCEEILAGYHASK